MEDKALDYSDICLIPKYSELESRSLVDVSTELFGRRYNLPVIPANMVDIINLPIARFLSQNGYFYVMHRFNNVTYGFVSIANKENWNLISISTGVNEDTLNELRKIKSDGLRVDVITIDVAHGWHFKVRKRIEWIKENLPNTKIIAGNVVTAQACEDLGEWGADCAKIFIGSGSICSTRYKTGFYVPHITCLQDCVDDFYLCGNIIKERKYPIPVIADGGCKHFGDITKALVLGAKACMSGYFFVSCIDSPAKIQNGQKVYNGSTSFAQKGENIHVEGVTLTIETGCTYQERLEEIKQSLQSAISYGGGTNLECLKAVEWLEI